MPVTLLRESLYDALLHYFNNLKISSDDPLFSTSMSYVEKISVRELTGSAEFLGGSKSNCPGC